MQLDTKEKESMDRLEGFQGPVSQTKRNFISWKLGSDHLKWRYDWVPPKTVKSARLFQILIFWSTPLMHLRELTTLASHTWSEIRQECLFRPAEIGWAGYWDQVLFNSEIAQWFIYRKRPSWGWVATQREKKENKLEKGIFKYNGCSNKWRKGHLAVSLRR
jgi:hypothetical protein